MTDRTLADPIRRRRQAAIAGHQGDAATARGFLGDDDAGVRAAALGALLRAHGLEPDDLVAALADEAVAVRTRALEVVAALHGGGAAAAVTTLPLLHDDDDTVVEVAAWAAGEREPAEPGAVDALAELARHHGDALVRESAVAALGAIGDPQGLAAILAATDDKATVRRRAVLALAPFEGPEVDAALERALTDRDWQVRQSAEDLTSN
ncbi:HEAT repeat domain-containing protein [Aquihabitans sp. McL0605]|uniref:HEAT repeat domain-containing protein n=1 Tax=Aquihabitans sp. McL0605 TaxID=3415671 RepID=UPI003CF27A1C